MAGTVYGLLDCKNVNASGVLDAGEQYVAIYTFMSGHPNWTLIARQGDGTYGGTTNNNFFVVRSNAQGYYMLVQVSNSLVQNFGEAPGNPGLLQGLATSAGGLGFQFAWGDDGAGGNGNPWAGTGVLGSSVKGSPVWVVPPGGSKLMVWPRSNSANILNTGNFSTLKQDCMGYIVQSVASHFTSMWADDDSFMLCRSVDGGVGYRVQLFGSFTPSPGLVYRKPLAGLLTSTGNLPFLAAQQYGTLNGVAVNNGGIASMDGSMVLYARVARLTTTYSATYQPNKRTTPNSHDLFPMHVYAHENIWQGNGGHFTFPAYECFNAVGPEISTDGLRAIFPGIATQATTKLVMPWKSGLAKPGTNTTKEGVSL